MRRHAFYHDPLSARLASSNLAEGPIQNSPHKRKYTHSSQQPDDTHQKSKDIQHWEATAWSWPRVCMHGTNGSNSICNVRGRVISSPIRPDVTYQPRTCHVKPISLPPSHFQRPVYRGRRESQGISGKYLHSVTIATDTSN